jgi:tetratricopeptide (TPR) repeat protein
LLEEAWKICEALSDPEALGRVLHILGYIYSNLADFHRSLECQQQAYAYHAKAENYHLMAWDLIDIGATYKKLGDLVQAERFIQDGLELSTRMGSQRAMAYALTKLGRLDLMRGEYAAALVHFQRVLEMQQAVHYGYIIAAAEAGMGFTLYLLGDYAYSHHWLERALQRSQASGLRKWEAETLIQLGILNIGEGQLALARQHLERGLQLARDCQSGECQAAGLAAQARLERLSGNLVKAQALADESASIAQQNDLTGCEMWAEMEKGLVLMEQGDLPCALDHTTAALILMTMAGQDWIGQEEVHLAHACTLRALNQAKDAHLQEKCARHAIEARADLISDPDQRSRYLSKSKLF